MAGEAAALLDELMGKRRNALPGKEMKETEWWDPEVCKYTICGFCPYGLFVNTRADMGSCPKYHDDKLRELYDRSDRCGKMGYEEEFLAHLEKLIRSLDRRIIHGRERLRKSAEAKHKQMTENLESDASEKLSQLNGEINSRVTRLDKLGRKGEVEEAQVLLKEVEALERERDRNRSSKTKEGSKTLAGFEVDANDFHEKMELCDVCGSFLVIGDSQSRVDAHLLGKQHMGYARIRAAIAELKNKLSSKIPGDQQRTDGGNNRERLRQGSSSSWDWRNRSRSPERGQRREHQHRSHSREKGRREPRRRSRSRERSRSKGRRQRSRERSRSKGRRHRSRERSRSKGRRHRSRERRSRSKERRRSKSKERRRSKSRERKRSKSKERRRSKSRERKRSRSKERRERSGSRGRRRRRSVSKERRKRSRSKEQKKQGSQSGERELPLPSTEPSLPESTNRDDGDDGQ